MITNNFSEIINVVVELSKENKLEELYSDDIRSLSLMLWGYLRLIKSGFKTKDDDLSIDSNHCYVHLKSILGELTSMQSKLLEKTKMEFIDNFNSEMDTLDKKFDLIPGLLVLNSKKEIKEVALAVSALKKQSVDVRKSLEEKLQDPYTAFESAMISCFNITSSMSEIIFNLLKHHQNSELSQYHKLLQKTSTYHLKKLTYWSEIELTNHQCMRYISNGEFIDLLMSA